MTDDRSTPERVVEEADRGDSERAPFLVLGGVTLTVAALVAVVLAIIVAVYVLA